MASTGKVSPRTEHVDDYKPRTMSSVMDSGVDEDDDDDEPTARTKETVVKGKKTPPKDDNASVTDDTASEFVDTDDEKEEESVEEEEDEEEEAEPEPKAAKKAEPRPEKRTGEEKNGEAVPEKAKSSSDRDARREQQRREVEADEKKETAPVEETGSVDTVPGVEQALGAGLSASKEHDSQEEDEACDDAEPKQVEEKVRVGGVARAVMNLGGHPMLYVDAIDGDKADVWYWHQENGYVEQRLPLGMLLPCESPLAGWQLKPVKTSVKLLPVNGGAMGLGRKVHLLTKSPGKRQAAKPAPEAAPKPEPKKPEPKPKPPAPKAKPKPAVKVPVKPAPKPVAKKAAKPAAKSSRKSLASTDEMPDIDAMLS